MSQNTPVDLRVRRTRKLLRDALVDLIEERGFDRLKVTEIADRAMVNRATFYRHYHGKQDLLERCMDDVFEELAGLITPPVTEDDAIDHHAPLKNLKLMLGHVEENAAFYRVMLGAQGPSAFASRIQDHLEKVTVERWQVMEPEGSGARMPPDLVIEFVAAAYVGVLHWLSLIHI
ncbi:MAG: TetR/AcrR family transcriptional regulator, partial [Chloroflexi bacterium]|nr:TetR/AcrR family transcriptional regulator [Chloroflexota bacterium]